MWTASWLRRPPRRSIGSRSSLRLDYGGGDRVGVVLDLHAALAFAVKPLLAAVWDMSEPAREGSVGGHEPRHFPAAQFWTAAAIAAPQIERRAVQGDVAARLQLR